MLMDAAFEEKIFLFIDPPFSHELQEFLLFRNITFGRRLEGKVQWNQFVSPPRLIFSVLLQEKVRSLCFKVSSQGAFYYDD